MNGSVRGRVADVMSDRVVEVPATAPAAEIARVMREEGVLRVFVTKRGRLVGVVTGSDLLACLESLQGNGMA